MNNIDVPILVAPFVLLYLFGPCILLVGALAYAIVRETRNAPTKAHLLVNPQVLRRPGEDGSSSLRASLQCTGYIAICNTGKLSVLCTEVGFAPNLPQDEWFRIRGPRSADGASWPLELKPGETTLVQAAPEELVESILRSRWCSAYVRTAMGDMFVATEKSMRAFRREVIEGWHRGGAKERVEGGEEGTGEVSPA